MADCKQSFFYGEVRRASKKKISEEKNCVRGSCGTLEVKRTKIPRGVRTSMFSVDCLKLARRPFALKRRTTRVLR